MEGGTEGVGVVLRANEPGGFNELDVLPLRMLPKERKGKVGGDRATVVGDGGYGGEFEDRVGRTVQLVGVVPTRVKLREHHAKRSVAGVPVYGLVENQGDVAA